MVPVPDTVEAHMAGVHLVDILPVYEPAPLISTCWQLDTEHLKKHKNNMKSLSVIIFLII
jgi:hypothetical protein